MANSLLRHGDPSQIQTWMRRLVWKIAIATLLLMAVGSATRVMDAGLACPDWPLCYGQAVPSQQMNLQVFLEWFHRLDAALIGASTLALAVLSGWFRRSLPIWMPWASAAALAAVVFQGLLGGLTVTELLRFDIVTAHLGTAWLFFNLLIAIGACLTPYQGTGASGRLAWLGLAAASLVWGQSLVGGLVASRWAVHQCLALPSAQLCSLLNSHLLGAIPATLAPGALAVLAWRARALSPSLRTLALTAGGLAALQVSLGVATLQFRLQVEPLTVAHHTVGASLLGTLVAFTVLALRDRPGAPPPP